MNNTATDWFEGSQIRERHYDEGASVVVGNQWGDEGKGKITDRLMQESDVGIRFNGGHNAGHTVKVGDKSFDLHILPSGMVSEGKINIITSGCVLGIDLHKIDIEKINYTDQKIYSTCTLEELFKRRDGEVIKVGLIPELEKLESGGINTLKSGLKISGEIMVIGMHNVLLDAFDEICRRKVSGLREIGSTGSGISRAYSAEIQRFHFSLNDLLYHEDLFYGSIEALWEGFKRIFPSISASDLIESARMERKKICKYIESGVIEVIGNEQQYIKSLHKKGKIIVGEGAQSSMIGAGNSFFGTASSPSLQSFCETTGLTVKKVGNVFLVHKMPPSSVGERPGYLKYPDSEALTDFRNQYNEIGVSTQRPRDLLHYSLPETARGAWLNVRGIDDESKIVPVYNRIDGIEDALALDNGVLRVVTGFQYEAQTIISAPAHTIDVGVLGQESITPKNLLHHYPEKSAQASLFGLNESNLRFAEISGSIENQVDQLLGLHNAAIFRGNTPKEFLVGTGPERNQLELRKGTPLRRIK